jgi:hypothetical protein
MEADLNTVSSFSVIRYTFSVRFFVFGDDVRILDRGKFTECGRANDLDLLAGTDDRDVFPEIWIIVASDGLHGCLSAPGQQKKNTRILTAGKEFRAPRFRPFTGSGKNEKETNP